MWLIVSCLALALAAEPDLAALRTEAEQRANDPGAAAAWQALLDAQLRALGPSHLDTATTQFELGRRLLKASDAGGAAIQFEQCYATRSAALGARTADAAACLGGLAAATAASGRPAEARGMMEQALAIREQVYGPAHAEVAKALENLSRLHFAQGNARAAMPLSDRALAIREAIGDLDDPALAIAVGDRANLAAALGRFEEAHAGYWRAIELIVRSGGPVDPRLANQWNNLGILESTWGRPAEARAAYEEALALHEATHGPVHPNVGAALLNLGNLLRNLGDYEAAERHLQRSREVYEATRGPTHPSTARAIGGLGAVAAERGQYERALALLDESRALTVAALGQDHPQVAITLQNLAAVALKAGDVARARSTYEDALRLTIARSGPDHPDVALIHTGLGSLAGELGDHETARQHFQESLRIVEVSLGPDDVAVASPLTNLAGLASRDGDWAGAERLHERALRVVAATWGEDHPDTIDARRALAVHLIQAGRPADALLHLQRARSDAERVLGRDHPSMGDLDHSIGVALTHVGDEVAAQAALVRALAVRRVVLGLTHARVGDTLAAIAEVARRSGDGTLALEASAHARANAESGLARLDALSEREGYAYLQSQRGRLDGWLALALPSVPGDQPDAYGVWLRWKGAVSRRMRDRHAALVADDPSARAHLEALDALRSERSANEQLKRTPLNREALDARLVAVVAAQEALERSLYDELPAWRAKTQQADATVADVQRALPIGSALVDFVRYQGPDGPRYAAFVVRPEGPIVHIPLGDAAVIDAEIASWRAAMVSPGPIASRVDARGAVVTGRVWRPLAPFIGDAERVWIVPDGAIATLPFAALPLGGGVYGVEAHAFATLPDAQTLLAPTHPPGRGVVLVGGLEYGTGAGPSCGMGALPPLPGTAREVEGLVPHYRSPRGHPPVDVLTGDDAREHELLRRVQGADVVHLATHGWYAATGCPTLQRAADDAVVGLDPMLLAGVALSGANAGGPPADDGVLTARELLSADLRGTRLVVLSGCATGLGWTVDGEGVLGLQRAATVSGAAQIVTSLWPVSDAATVPLMEGMAHGWADRRTGGDAISALREAQLVALGAQRDAYGEATPATWAAFVATGVPAMGIVEQR